jgi:hypothetical protein
VVRVTPSEAADVEQVFLGAITRPIEGTKKGALPCAHGSYIEVTLVWSA